MLEISKRAKILLEPCVNDLSAAIGFRVECYSHTRFYTQAFAQALPELRSELRAMIGDHGIREICDAPDGVNKGANDGLNIQNDK